MSGGMRIRAVERIRANLKHGKLKQMAGVLPGEIKTNDLALLALHQIRAARVRRIPMRDGQEDPLGVAGRAKTLRR